MYGRKIVQGKIRERTSIVRRTADRARHLQKKNHKKEPMLIFVEKFNASTTNNITFTNVTVIVYLSSKVFFLQASRASIVSVSHNEYFILRIFLKQCACQFIF